MKKVFMLFSMLLTIWESNAQVNLTAGLVAYFPFNGNTLDASGNGNNATNFGATLTSDQWGNPNSAYLFNGTSNYMKILNNSGLQPTQISLCAKVKPMGFYNGLCYNSCIIDKGNSDYIAGDYGFRFTNALSGNCNIPGFANQNYRSDIGNIGSSSFALPFGGTPYVATNQWDCLISTYDGTTVNVYVNGTLRYSYAQSTIGTNADDIFLGRKNSATYPYWYNGVMDEIRIYNRAINAQEIQALCGCNSNSLLSNILLNNDTTLCATAAVPLHTNPSIGSTSIFTWSPTTSLNDSTSLNPVASPLVTTTYHFNLLNAGCNIIDNGDFENGNTGFTSQYSYAAVNTIEGEYTVGSNPQSWNGALGSFGDHTTGTGKMLIVNGAPVPNQSIWCKTVAVSPNTDYAFSAWIMNANIWGAASNPPTLQFSINGNLMGTPFTSTTTAGVWQQFYQTWNSGLSTTANICIVNQNTIISGNDFAIDDISFSPYVMQTDSVTITIHTPPSVTAGPDTSICSGHQVQLHAAGANNYSWNPAATLNNAFISNPIANVNTTTVYTVTGTDNSGCSNTATVSVSIKPTPNVTGTATPPSVCHGSPTILTGSGASTYTWSSGVSNGISFIPGATSTYTVTGTNAFGCTSSSTVTVTVVNNLNINILPSEPVICIGDSVHLNASGANSYSWSPNTSISSLNVPDPIVNPSSATTYTVIGTDATGCTGTASVLIDVVTNPKMIVSKSGDVECNIQTIQLSASGTSTSYVWSPATFLSSPNSGITNATLTQTTTFMVTGTVGSCVITDSITVDVYNNDETAIYIPNAFSPNGDGMNDCLRVLNTAHFSSYYFAIYNRWGQRVFEADSPDKCWDGTFNNQPALLDVYYYFMKAETRCGKVFKKGDITLIR